MQKIASNIFVEKGFPGVDLGLIVGDQGVILVDCPIDGDDAREWLDRTAEYGSRRYLTLLDSFTDRVVGARGLSIPIVAHDNTRLAIRDWPDAFKGSSHPIGALSDDLKRITGLGKTVPELTFSDQMTIDLGDRQVQFLHQPGPTTGSIWVLVPDAKVVFIGDTITLSEPPYLGAADIEGWLASLKALRHKEYQSYKRVSGRDGLVGNEDINTMARFLRRVFPGLERASKAPEPSDAIVKMAKRMLASFELASPKRKTARLRLEVGLADLYRRLHSSKS